MRRVVLVASVLAVLELAESSILNRVEQHRVNTKKLCFEEGSALSYELEKSTKELMLKCLDDDEFGKYLDFEIDFDTMIGQLTCKQNAPEKVKASVQEWGRLWHKVWISVPDPTICETYEFVNTFVKSCN